MARKSPLRVATAADVRPEPKTLVDAAALSERTLLVKMRSLIAAEIDRGVPPHALAPLVRQLRDIAKEIEAIDLRAKEEGADAADVADDEGWDAEAL